MLIFIFKSYINHFKGIKNFLISFSINNLKKKKKGFSLFFKKNFFFFSLHIKNYDLFFNYITKNLNTFFQGFCYRLTLEGKRFKFLINRLFIFLKMDTSHFKYLNFKNNFFLKKLKKNKILFFYSFDIKYIKFDLLKIQFFKKPTKYKKKGLFLNQLFL